MLKGRSPLYLEVLQFPPRVVLMTKYSLSGDGPVVTVSSDNNCFLPLNVQNKTLHLFSKPCVANVVLPYLTDTVNFIYSLRLFN